MSKRITTVQLAVASILFVLSCTVEIEAQVSDRRTITCEVLEVSSQYRDEVKEPADQKELAQYNTSDARTYFAQLLERVRHGEEIVIARAGKPVAKLVPFDDDRPRHSGVIRAHVVMRRR